MGSYLRGKQAWIFLVGLYHSFPPIFALPKAVYTDLTIRVARDPENASFRREVYQISGADDADMSRPDMIRIQMSKCM
jgi:hypothetical protein